MTPLNTPDRSGYHPTGVIGLVDANEETVTALLFHNYRPVSLSPPSHRGMGQRLRQALAEYITGKAGGRGDPRSAKGEGRPLRGQELQGICCVRYLHLHGVAAEVELRVPKRRV